jgi:hypothetical protein
VARPLLPTDAGLRVLKSSLVLDTRTTISASETITGKYFPQGVMVTGGDVVFEDCWLYGGPHWSLRNNGGTSLAVRFCEFGITVAEGFVEADHLVSSSITGDDITCEDSYFHHAQDFVRLGDRSVYRRNYMHHHVIIETSHADSMQSTGGSDWIVNENTIINDLAPDIDLGGTGMNRAIHVGREFGPSANIEITDNYMDGVGNYILALAEGVTGVVTGNRFGRSSIGVALYANAFPTGVVHTDNRYADDLTLIEGENMPASHLDKDEQGAIGTVTLTLPPQARAGQLAVVGIRVREITGTLTAPAGWTLVQKRPTTTGTVCELFVFTKLVEAGETPGVTQYDFSYSDGFKNVRGVLLLEDVGEPPVAASASAFDDGWNTAYLAPSVTTTEDDQTVLAFFAAAANTTVGSPSPAMTERSQRTDAGGFLAVYEYTAGDAGATGQFQVTGGGSDRTLGATVALTNAPVSSRRPRRHHLDELRALDGWYPNIGGNIRDLL